MEERDADRRAVARGLRRAFAVEPEVPDRFRVLLDRIGGQDAGAAGAPGDGPVPGGTGAPRGDH
jgi:hypothetical protein